MIKLADHTVSVKEITTAYAAVNQFDPLNGCMVREDYTFAVEKGTRYVQGIKGWVAKNCVIGGIEPFIIDMWCDEWETPADDALRRTRDPLEDEF